MLLVNTSYQCLHKNILSELKNKLRDYNKKNIIRKYWIKKYIRNTKLPDIQQSLVTKWLRLLIRGCNIFVIWSLENKFITTLKHFDKFIIEYKI